MARMADERGAGRCWIRASRVAGCALLLLASAAGTPAQEVDLPGSDRPAAVGTDLVYSVGGVDAEPWAQFVELPQAAFDGKGRLYLLDPAARTVVVVGPDGALLHRIGAIGDGPGEYRAPSGVAALPDGTAVVWDARKRAFLQYAPDGSHLRELRLDYEVGLPDGPLAVRGLAEDGTPELVSLPAQLFTGRLGRAYVSGAGVDAAEGSLPLLDISLRDGARVQALTRVSVAELEGPPPHPARRAFEPEPSWGLLSGDRVAVHDGDAYRIRILASDGSVERILTRPLKPRPVTARDREAYLASIADEEVHVLGGGGGGAPPPRPDPWFHPVIPAIRRITADGAGGIWVERPDPVDALRAGPVDLLDAGGRYLGTLSAGEPGLPAAFGPDGLIAVIRSNELDVPVVEVYRIRD